MIVVLFLLFGFPVVLPVLVAFREVSGWTSLPFLLLSVACFVFLLFAVARWRPLALASKSNGSYFDSAVHPNISNQMIEWIRNRVVTSLLSLFIFEGVEVD